jgi:hypothetical protein
MDTPFSVSVLVSGLAVVPVFEPVVDEGAGVLGDTLSLVAASTKLEREDEKLEDGLDIIVGTGKLCRVCPLGKVLEIPYRRLAV